MTVATKLAGSTFGRVLRAHQVVQELARVEATLPDGYLVRGSGVPIAARRAASCLLAPEVGDRVLIAVSELGEAFVLAVLEQSSEVTRLTVSGDLELRARSVSIAADEAVRIGSGDELQITAPKLALRTLEGTIFAEALTFLGKTVSTEVDRVKINARAIDSVLERWSQRVKRSFRVIEEVDQVRSGAIDYAAQGNAHLRAENTVVTAEKLVKLNGEQVHIG